MLDREDGPTKHYRYTCDGKGCKAETKRGIEEPPDLDDPDLAGWTSNEDTDQHFCPKCSGNPPPQAREIVQTAGKGLDLSDHESVSVVLKREATDRLVIDIGNGSTVVITADTPIKAEQHYS